jgi:DNA polymerase I-like protein with 3'-5' exonuclease and polymerase domains
MSQLPASVLGPYCASDADAAWQLHQELHTYNLNLNDYHTRIFLPQIQLLAEQQLRGTHIDKPALKTCHATLLDSIEKSLKSFLSHPEVTHHITAHNNSLRDAWKLSQPPTTTKAGLPSARYMAWQFRKLLVFNSNSKKQLADLFYNKMGYKAAKHTPTGRPVLDRKVLPSLGEPGKLLNVYNLQVKRRGYVESLIGKSERDGLVHPSFNSVGTVTGRLGGSGGLNLQQMPKVADFLSCFSARPGHVLVQLDLEAIEPTILAEFSQDKTMLQVYGAGAKPNDIYLLIASKIPALCKEVRNYYDPENPTAEGITAAKKHCKKERSIAKVCKLAYDYGAGVAKMHETLVQSGVSIGVGEVRDIRSAMDRMFPGIKRFEDSLKDIWEANSGWIPSILGTPICVDHKALKDIVNRFCQTSGHQVLQLLISYVQEERYRRGITMYPWLLDLHDETIWETLEGDDSLLAIDVIQHALARTNTELGMGIPVKGTPMIARTLADIKCT